LPLHEKILAADPSVQKVNQGFFAGEKKTAELQGCRVWVYRVHGGAGAVEQRARGQISFDSADGHCYEPVLVTAGLPGAMPSRRRWRRADIWPVQPMLPRTPLCFL
jgi:hypothetical protein